VTGEDMEDSVETCTNCGDDYVCLDFIRESLSDMLGNDLPGDTKVRFTYFDDDDNEIPLYGGLSIIGDGVINFYMTSVSDDEQ